MLQLDGVPKNKHLLCFSLVICISLCILGRSALKDGVRHLLVMRPDHELVMFNPELRRKAYWVVNKKKSNQH